MVGNASLSMELWSAFVLLAGQDQDAKKVGIYIPMLFYTTGDLNANSSWGLLTSPDAACWEGTENRNNFLGAQLK